MLSLERLEAITDAPAATHRPLGDAAPARRDRALPRRPDRRRVRAPVTIVDAGSRKELDVEVIVPVDDMTEPGAHSRRRRARLPTRSGSTIPRPNKSIWPHVHPRMLELIRAHRTTIVFCNARRTRGTARRAASTSSRAKSSCARAPRIAVARATRCRSSPISRPAGCAASSRPAASSSASTWARSTSSCSSSRRVRSRAACSASGAPATRSASRAPARSSRSTAATCSKPAIVVRRMREGLVEEMRYPRNPLDVLAQQIVAACAVDEWDVDDAARARAPRARTSPSSPTTRSARRSTCSRAATRPIGSRACGRASCGTASQGRVRAREGAQRVAVASGGTIPDRGLFGVFLPDGVPRRRARRGDGLREPRRRDASCSARRRGASRRSPFDRVVVTPAPGEPAQDAVLEGRPAGPAARARPRARRAWCASCASCPADEAEARLRADGLDARAASNLRAYLDEQAESTGAVPDDRTIVDRALPRRDRRLARLHPHAVRLARARAVGARDRGAARPRSTCRCRCCGPTTASSCRLPGVDRRHPARAAALRSRRDRRARRRARCRARRCSRRGSARTRRARCCSPAAGPASARRCGSSASARPTCSRSRPAIPTFPMLLETTRECLRDVFDLPALREVLTDIRSRKRARRAGRDHARVAVRAVACCSAGSRSTCTRATRPSPSAGPRHSRSTATCCATCSAPKSSASCSIPRCSPSWSSSCSGSSRRGRPATPTICTTCSPTSARSTLDEVARALRRPIPQPWLDELLAERRVIRAGAPLRPRSKMRHACATRSASRSRPGCPPRSPIRSTQPLDDLVARYARTHGPFIVEEVAGRLGVTTERARDALTRLEAEARVVFGEFRPGGVEREWCDAGVLRVAAPPFARGDAPRDRAGRRRDVRAVPARVAGRRAGPARPRRARRDARTAARRRDPGVGARARRAPGAGRGLPAGDARRAVRGRRAGVDRRRRARCRRRARPPASSATGSAARVRSGRRRAGPRVRCTTRCATASPRAGASFWPDLVAAAGTADEAVVLTALWDLVWAGEVTNDTFGPLRVPAARGARARRAGAGPTRRGWPASGRRPARAAGRWSRRCSSRHRRPPRSRTRDRAAAARTPRRASPAKPCAPRASPGGFAGVYPVLARAGGGGPRAARLVRRRARRRAVRAAGRGRPAARVPHADRRRTGDASSCSRRPIPPSRTAPRSVARAHRRRPAARRRRARRARRRRTARVPRARRQEPPHLRVATRRRRLGRARSVEAHKEGRLGRLQIERIDDEPARTSPTAPRAADGRLRRRLQGTHAAQVAPRGVATRDAAQPPLRGESDSIYRTYSPANAGAASTSARASSESPSISTGTSSAARRSAKRRQKSTAGTRDDDVRNRRDGFVRRDRDGPVAATGSGHHDPRRRARELVALRRQCHRQGLDREL